MANLIESGGPVMYILLFCSVISLAVIIERMAFWMSARTRMDSAEADTVIALCASGDWEAAEAAAAASKSPVVAVLASGIQYRDLSFSKAMAVTAAEAVGRMRRFMGVMDTIITAAPLIGILGTVIGIILSFEALGQAGIGRPQAITAGIAQALITTAAGLVIAIFTVFPFNYFNTRIERSMDAIECHATRLELVLEKVPGPSGGQP